MPGSLPRTALVPVLVLAAAIPAAGGGAVLVSATAATASSSPSTPFSLSGLPAQSRAPSAATTPVTSGTTYRGAALSAASLTAGTNVDVIGNNDVTQQATINGVNVFTCNPGKDTAQNETTIASSGSTLAPGANDYRLYEPSANPADSPAGFYPPTDRSTAIAVAVLPGLRHAVT